MRAKEDYKPYTVKYGLINIYKETIDLLLVNICYISTIRFY